MKKTWLDDAIIKTKQAHARYSAEERMSKCRMAKECACNGECHECLHATYQQKQEPDVEQAKVHRSWCPWGMHHYLNTHGQDWTCPDCQERRRAMREEDNGRFK